MQSNFFLLIHDKLALTTSSTFIEFPLNVYPHLLAKLVEVKPGQSDCI